MIDIVICTRNRLEYTQQTLERLFACTRYPYQLHIIDDNSTDETVPYLLGLWQNGRLASLTLSHERRGMMANRNLSTWLAFSDPFVLCDNDVLCPDVEPCWLERGVITMGERPNLGILALFHPGAYRGACYGQDDKVVTVDAVGNTFMFVRRQVVQGWHHAHFRENFGVPDEVQRCCRAREVGMTVGVLKDTYCYHIGIKSSLTSHDYSGPFIEPLDWKTLRPSEEWLYKL